MFSVLLKIIVSYEPAFIISTESIWNSKRDDVVPSLNDAFGTTSTNGRSEWMLLNIG